MRRLSRRGKVRARARSILAVAFAALSPLAAHSATPSRRRARCASSPLRLRPSPIAASTRPIRKRRASASSPGVAASFSRRPQPISAAGRAWRSSRRRNSFLAISDAGTWMTGDSPTTPRAARPACSRCRLGPLEAIRGKALQRERDRDAEGLPHARGDACRRARALISFERNHRIGRFDIGPKGSLGDPRATSRCPPP